MALVVEDGTGLPTANSYVDVAEFDAYWLDRNREDLVDAQPEVKEAALILATDWLDLSFRWVGVRKVSDPALGPQALEWPRQSVIDPYTLELVDEDSVPVEIRRAAIEAAAVAISSDLMPTTTAAQTLSVGAGPLRRVFARRVEAAPVLRKAMSYAEKFRAGDGLRRA